MIWHNRGLRALLVAQGVSRLGSQMTFLALPWFVLVTTGSAARMSIVLAVELLPIAVFGIPSGALVSRLGARRTMMVADAGRVPLMCSLPLLSSAGLLTFPLLLALVFLVGCFLAPYMSASTVVIPELVGNEEHTIAQANAAMEGVQRATLLLGPPLAGVLIGVIGAASVLYLDAATFLFSFLVIAAFVPRRPPVAQSDESRGVLAGIRFVLHDQLLRPIALTSMALNMFGQMLVASLLVLARDNFGSARIAGLFFAAFGAGALIGSVLAIRLVTRHDPIRLGAVSLLLLMAPFPLLALDLPAAVVALVIFVAEIFGPLVNAPLIAVMMTRTPEALRPKVMSAVLTTALLAGPIGLLVVGPLLQDLGARPVILLVAVGQFLATLPFTWMALRRHGPVGASAASA